MRLFLHPHGIWLESAGGQEHFASRDVQERQDETLANAFGGHNVLGEEVTLPEGLRVRFEKIAPASLRRVQLGIQLVLPQDVNDGAARHLDLEFSQLADDARVPPGILPRQSLHPSRT